MLARRAGVRASIRLRSDSLTGLWSEDSSMQRPRRHSTARLSPRLATKTRRPSSSATTAVVPHANASPPDRSASSVACSPARCAWRAVARQRWRIGAGVARRRRATAEAAAETLTRHGRGAPRRLLRPRCARGRAGVAALAPPSARAGAHRRPGAHHGCRDIGRESGVGDYALQQVLSRVQRGGAAAVAVEHLRRRRALSGLRGRRAVARPTQKARAPCPRTA